MTTKFQFIIMLIICSIGVGMHIFNYFLNGTTDWFLFTLCFMGMIATAIGAFTKLGEK